MRDTPTDECLFCRIVAGVEPTELVYQDADVVAFKDKFPQAPVHVLVVPRLHRPSVDSLSRDDDELLGRCFETARQVAAGAGIEEGYRIATNVGAQGGQAIFHLHFHVIGGRQLGHIDGA